jgi:glycerol-3-phosphate dehydrogenase subunit C
LSSTDAVGRLAGIPVVVQAVNATNQNRAARRVLDKTFGIHSQAILPKYHSTAARRRMRHSIAETAAEAQPAGPTRGKVVLFTTCYGKYNEPQLGEDLITVYRHNGIPVRLAPAERCCGMPKLELGDLEAVACAKQSNVAMLAKLVDEGWDIVAPVPSCVLMFKQEYPLMFPDDVEVTKVRDAIYDPFEYLMLRHKEGALKLDFKNPLGKISYHVACHLRVQNIGLKTRELLQLVPETQVEAIERCSGHNGTYAVKSEFHEMSMKIGRPVVKRVQQAGADHYSSDCPMAGHQIENGLAGDKAPEHPLTLLRQAYGL